MKVINLIYTFHLKAVNLIYLYTGPSRVYYLFGQVKVILFRKIPNVILFVFIQGPLPYASQAVVGRKSERRNNECDPTFIFSFNKALTVP